MAEGDVVQVGTPVRLCSEPGCEKVTRPRGTNCWSHYNRRYRATKQGRAVLNRENERTRRLRAAQRGESATAAVTNAEYRRKATAAALVDAPPELAQLIDSQTTGGMSLMTGVRLDAPVGGTENTLLDLSLTHGRIWEDPTAHKALNLVRSTEVQSLVKQCPVVPRDWRGLLVEGAVRLIVDNSGPRFVQTVRNRVDAVPWQDFAGPLPPMAIMSAGKMRRAHRHPQVEKVGWSRGHGSRKSKVAA